MKVVRRKGAPWVKFTFTGEHVMIMAHIYNVQKVWLYIHDFPKFYHTGKFSEVAEDVFKEVGVYLYASWGPSKVSSFDPCLCQQNMNFWNQYSSWISSSTNLTGECASNDSYYFTCSLLEEI